VDQHATDEKYNYETLQKTTVLNTQLLLTYVLFRQSYFLNHRDRPMNLDLPAADELVLVDNLDTFKLNGFDFVLDLEAEAGHRVKLKSYPYSRSTSFGPRDIEELIFLLRDHPGETFWCSRVRSMFASYIQNNNIFSFYF